METKPKILKWALIIGIVVVLNLFFNYTISLFYKEPDYNAYFTQPQIVQPSTDVLKQQIEQQKLNEEQKNYNDAREIYNRNVFIMLIILGVISLALGAFLANEILTLGLSWGGVLSLIIASMRYWGTADNWIKVLILGLALAVLIWLAIKKFGNNLKNI